MSCWLDSPLYYKWHANSPNGMHSGFCKTIYSCNDVCGTRREYVRVAAYYVKQTCPHWSDEQCWLVGEHEIDSHYLFTASAPSQLEEAIEAIKEKRLVCNCAESAASKI